MNLSGTEQTETIKLSAKWRQLLTRHTLKVRVRVGLSQIEEIRRIVELNVSLLCHTPTEIFFKLQNSA